MRFPTTHGVRGGAPTPRCGSATCARGGLAPRDNTRAGGVWLGPTRRTHPSSIRPRVPSPESSRDLCPARGGDAPRARRAPTHPPSEAIGRLPRFEKIKDAEPGGAECRAVPCTRGPTAPARSRVLSTPSRSGVCPGAPHALPAYQRRAHYTRAPPTAVLSIGAAAGELSPPQVAAEKILRDGAERSNRCKQLSLGLDYTN
jgi:hypothetical protein